MISAVIKDYKTFERYILLKCPFIVCRSSSEGSADVYWHWIRASIPLSMHGLFQRSRKYFRIFFLDFFLFAKHHIPMTYLYHNCRLMAMKTKFLLHLKPYFTGWWKWNKCRVIHLFIYNPPIIWSLCYHYYFTW